MSTRELEVLLGHHHAGTIKQLKGGRLTFEYSAPYSTLRGATPLSVSMPLQVSTHTDGRITPWLWGLLPDNDAVLSRWARQFHVSGNSAFSLLATPIGEDCPGAVQLLSPERLAEVTRNEPPSDVEWLSEAQVATRLRELKEDSTAWLGTRHGGRFSLAGAQAKTALLYDPAHGWGAPQGGAATTHIIKPSIEGLDDHDLNEHICLSGMRVAGLRAVRSSIERFEDQSAIVIARYDRLEHGGQQVRLHQEDLCQALGIHPTSKYQNEGGPGPRDVTSLFKRTMPSPVAREAARAFLDALIWNWVIAGTDAHAKNYSLLLSGSQTRLAPLYDVASALPYNLPIQKMRLAMKWGSGYKLDPVSDPWPRLARDLDLPLHELQTRATTVVTQIPDAIATAANEPFVRALNSGLPARLKDSVAKRASTCQERLARPFADR